jgi:prolipoprotein diacylglyceryltransferase
MNLTDIWDQLVKTFRSTMAIFGGILLILLITWVVSKINKAVPHSTIKHSTKGFFKVLMTIVHGVGEKRPSSRDI